MIPHEIDIHGVYAPPILIVLALSMVATWLTVWLLNRWRLSRHLMFPRLVYLSVIALYVVAFGTFIIRI